jgi:hypothetical protein
MDAGEYWLLDSVVESRDSLALLVSNDIETAFNKRSHGLTREQLINVLERLFLGGDLLAHHWEKSGPKKFFIPTRTEIEEAFNGRVRCFYGLTSQGGARWEEVSQPRWERYIHDAVYAEPRDGEIIGSDRNLVEQYDSFESLRFRYFGRSWVRALGRVTALAGDILERTPSGSSPSLQI